MPGMLIACCACHRPGAAAQSALAFEVMVADRAIAEGDFKHARHHVAGAMGLAPTDPGVLDLFERLAGCTDLTGDSPSPYFGDVAVTALAGYRAGRKQGAIALLAQVAAAMPQLGFEHLLTAWVADSEDLDAEASLAVARLLGSVGESTIGIHRLLPGERALIASYSTLARAFAATDPVPASLAVTSGMLRRAGHFDEATTVARQAGGTSGWLQGALALRAQGDGSGALSAFLEAARLSSGDGYEVERARCKYVMGDRESALQLLEGRGDEDPELVGLRRLCSSPVAGDPVAQLDALRRAARHVTLRAVGDAGANGLAQCRSKGLKGASFKVNGWESPSNRLLAALCDGHADVRRVQYTMKFEDSPRPVLAQTRGSAPLWKDEGGVIVQAGPAPSGDLTLALAEVVLGIDVDGLEGILDRASRVAARFPEAGADEFAAAMVHPPVLVAEGPADQIADRLFLYQLACACAIASMPAAQALPRLEAIAFGPVDWSSGAAVLALGELVRRDAVAAVAGRAALLALPADLVPFSSEPRFQPLVDALCELPGVPQSTWTALGAWHREYVGGPADEQPGANVPGTGAGPNEAAGPPAPAPSSRQAPMIWRQMTAPWSRKQSLAYLVMTLAAVAWIWFSRGP